MDDVAGREDITSMQGENCRASLTGWWCSPVEVGRKHGKIHPAERRAGITAVGGQKQQPNVIPEPLAAQGQIPEMENLFEEATVKAVIKKANPQSATGPSGLRYSHL